MPCTVDARNRPAKSLRSQVDIIPLFVNAPPSSIFWVLPVAVALIACVVTNLLTPLVGRVALTRGWTGREAEGRHLHRAPVPRLGGIPVFAGVAAGLCLLPLLTLDEGQVRFFRGIFLGGLMLLGIGLLDDVREIRPRWKVAVQVLAAMVVFFHGFRIDALTLGSAATLELGWLALPVTILWVVTISNAYNLIDGLDGLATGIALIALGAVLLAAGILGRHPEVVLAGAAVFGALVGFLPHNSHPARIFLGDSGSLFVGFLLAVLSVHGSIGETAGILAVIPVLALALPLLDTGLAIGRRWLRGVPISAGDANHIHHRLLALGLSRRKAVQTLYLASMGLAILGLVLAFAPGRAEVLAAVASFGLGVVLLRSLRHLDYFEFAVAGNVLARGLDRARRRIRDGIYAQEVAKVLRVATDLTQVHSILADNADTFGFLHMELCWESQHTRRKRKRGAGAQQWKVDFPVSSCDEDPLVLRVWCETEDGFDPRSAERVAHVLAPVLAEVTGGFTGARPQRETDSVASRGRAASGDLLPLHPNPRAVPNLPAGGHALRTAGMRAQGGS